MSEVISDQVVLSDSEMKIAALVGTNRNTEAISKGLLDKHGFKGDGWSVNIEGACGELAFAKFANQYWNGSVNTFKSGGDVGKLQVRTRSDHSYDLIIRPDDRDSDYFILVTGQAPVFRVRGFILAGDAKRMTDCIQTHGGRPPAWFIPSNRLNRITCRMQIN